MTVEEIEAIAGGYHGDAFRILGPHSVRKKGGQARWEVRAFLPQAESAEVVAAGERAAMARSTRRASFAPRSPAIRSRTSFARACTMAARSKSTIPTVSGRSSPIPTSTCTPRARSTKPGARWARTSPSARACAACASPCGRPTP